MITTQHRRNKFLQEKNLDCFSFGEQSVKRLRAKQQAYAERKVFSQENADKCSRFAEAFGIEDSDKQNFLKEHKGSFLED